MTTKEKIRHCKAIIEAIAKSVTKYHICTNYTVEHTKREIANKYILLEELRQFGKASIKHFSCGQKIELGFLSPQAFGYGTAHWQDYNDEKVDHLIKYVRHLENKK